MLSPHTAKLCDVATGKVLTPIFHVDRLKLGRLKKPPEKPAVPTPVVEQALGDAGPATNPPLAVPTSVSDVGGQVSDSVKDVEEEEVPDEAVLAQKGQGASLRYRMSRRAT